MKLAFRLLAIRVCAFLGRYEKRQTGELAATGRANYFYVVGPFLPLARFCVITEDTEHQKDRWTKDWMTGKPSAVLWFSFWNLKFDVREKATYQEVLWFLGFQEVDAARREP